MPELAFALPTAIAHVPEAERGARCRISDDLCVLDQQHYFVRCVLHLPVRGESDGYGIGVWSTLSASNFKIYADDFHGSRAAAFGPFLGWLANTVPTFDNPYEQKCRLHFRTADRRPTIELEPTAHPLTIAQRDGSHKAMTPHGPIPAVFISTHPVH